MRAGLEDINFMIVFEHAWHLIQLTGNPCWLRLMSQELQYRSKIKMQACFGSGRNLVPKQRTTSKSKPPLEFDVELSGFILEFALEGLRASLPAKGFYAWKTLVDVLPPETGWGNVCAIKQGLSHVHECCTIRPALSEAKTQSLLGCDVLAESGVQENDSDPKGEGNKAGWNYMGVTLPQARALQNAYHKMVWVAEWIAQWILRYLFKLLSFWSQEPSLRAS